jgi:hypothetical protein
MKPQKSKIEHNKNKGSIADSMLKLSNLDAPSISSSSNDIDTAASQEEILQDKSDRELISKYCSQLSLSQEIEQYACILFDMVKTKNNEKEVLRENQYYALCSIFFASRVRPISNQSKPDDKAHHFELTNEGLSISQILNVDKSINLVELYEMINTAVPLFKFESTECYKQIKNAQKRLIITDCIFKEFSEYFSSHYVEDKHFNELKTFSWILFLLSGNKTYSRLLDFEESYQLLQSVLLFLWKNTPKEWKIKGADQGSIFKLFDIRFDDIKPYIAAIPASIIDQLQQNSSQRMRDVLLKTKEINKIYDKVVEKMDKVAFDGRLYLDDPDVTIGSITKLQSARVYQLNPKKISDYIEQHPELQSPLRSSSSAANRPKTVMHATLRLIQQIKIKVSNENDFPDAELLRFFKSCNGDLTEAIVNRLNSLVDKISLKKLENEQEATFRTTLIKKVYYQVLKEMLLDEEKRLQRSNFATLLSNENFHKSHLVCSAETVLFAYNMRDCLEFVDLLDIFELEPFDLSVSIESFVLHATWMNSALRRHFRTIEEKLLDSVAWRNGSILYEKLEQQSGSLTPPPQLGSMTPVAKKRQHVFNVYGSSVSQDTQQQKGSVALNLFMRKLYRIIWQRIYDLCTEFNRRNTSIDRTISQDVMKHIWYIVSYVINFKQSLMVNRHVDHMIMCAMYAVCNKVNKMSWICFRDIMNVYRVVCENNRNISPVEIGKILSQATLDDNKAGDIVKFYNNVFIPDLKVFILQSPQENASSMPLPEIPVGDSMQSPQRLRVSKTAKVFVSPLKSPVRHNPSLRVPPTYSSYQGVHSSSLTPRTKALYSFKDAYTEKLIAHDIHSATTPSSAKRALDFSDSSDNTDSPHKFRRVQNARRSIDFSQPVDGESAEVIAQENEPSSEVHLATE